ncbi:hypothetical protein [Gorillibacterium sp. CAU 1737]|uniref:hypothetical protein n=1 Tax=Gorillibacterium sp. CAU 1737 TaxID=3140362 RepID=UPI003260973A
MKVKTDAELNRELSVLLGYEVIERKGQFYLFDPFSLVIAKSGVESLLWTEIPDYCNDETAAREVQKAAIAKDLLGYVLNLSIKTKAPKYFLDWDTSGLDGYFFNANAVAMMLTATPRQRAEAAYMVLKGDERS